MTVYFGMDKRTLSDIVSVDNTLSNEFSEYKTIGSLLIKPNWLSAFPALCQSLFTNKLNRAFFKVIEVCYENGYSTIDYSNVEQAFSTFAELSNAQQYIYETLGNGIEDFVTALREIQTNDVSKTAKNPSADIKILWALKMLREAKEQGIDISHAYDEETMQFKVSIGYRDGFQNFLYTGRREYNDLSPREKVRACESIMMKHGLNPRELYNKWEGSIENDIITRENQGE